MQAWAWWVLSALLLMNAAALALWWRTQQAAGQLQRRLARSEEARFQMRRDLQALEARLATADTELTMHRQLADGDGEAPPSEPPPNWDDTQAFDSAEPGSVRTQPGAGGTQAAR